MLISHRAEGLNLLKVAILITILSLTACFSDKKCDVGSKDCQENIEKGIDLYDNNN